MKHKTPYEWREKHPKCAFCTYCTFNSPSTKYGIPCADYYKCEVKEKIIHLPRISRRFCKCFRVRPVEKFNKEITKNA